MGFAAYSTWQLFESETLTLFSAVKTGRVDEVSDAHLTGSDLSSASDSISFS